MTTQKPTEPTPWLTEHEVFFAAHNTPIPDRPTALGVVEAEWKAIAADATRKALTWARDRLRRDGDALSKSTGPMGAIDKRVAFELRQQAYIIDAELAKGGDGKEQPK